MKPDHISVVCSAITCLLLLLCLTGCVTMRGDMLESETRPYGNIMEENVVMLNVPLNDSEKKFLAVNQAACHH
jgi:hypothetical protein